MKVVRLDSFVRDFKTLPEDVKIRVDKALRLLVANPRHPSLRVKTMQPKGRGILEARASDTYRITFMRGPGVLILRRVGTHDILRTP